MNPLYYIFLSIFFNTCSHLLFKKGVVTKTDSGNGSLATNSATSIIGMLFHPPIFFGLVLSGLAAVFWLFALSHMDLSYVFPFLSLNYILIPVLASIFYKEKLSHARLAGIGIICVGVVLIAFS